MRSREPKKKPFPGDTRPADEDLAELVDILASARVALQWASVYTLRVALGMLTAQILSRRAMISTNHLTQEALDLTARAVQCRVARCEEIVAELRRRGEKVEWEP